MLKDDQDPQAMLTLENFSNSIGASVVSVSAQAKQGAKMNEVFQQLQSKFFNELVDGYTKPNDACKNIGHMPTSIARQFLTKLACIIQEDGEVGLLDALLLERVKRELNLMPAHLPTSFEDVKAQIVHLIDALLHVQQINSPNQLEVRERILQQILAPEEMQIYADISDEPLDLAEILNDVSGLLLRDRLNILAIAERCLWSDRIITQDELDVLELLYWRLGFDTREVVEQMQKKNSLMII